MSTYVAYYRISKESKSGQKEKRHLGLEAQKAIVNHYYDITKSFTEIKSAKNITERKELQKAIEYCKSNGATLVVAKIDRLSRSVDDCLYIYKTLNKRVRSCDIPGEIDKFTLTLYAAFAERERELISIRTSQAVNAKIKRGEKWSTGNKDYINGVVAAIGRKAASDKAKTDVNNIRAISVIKDKINTGMNYSQIAEHLNANGFKTSRNNEFRAEQVKRLYERAL